MLLVGCSGGIVVSLQHAPAQLVSSAASAAAPAVARAPSRDDGPFTALYSFRGSPDGEEPMGNLVDLNGTLYGTTPSGGSYQNGTIFSSTL